MPSVHVWLTGVQNSYTATTDSNGEFSVAAAPDLYTMTTSKCNYLPDTRSVTSDPGFQREEEVFLTKAGLATVFGIVRDDSGNPLADAQVKETCTGTYVMTDSSGSYSLQTVPGGVSVTVIASKYGYVSDGTTVNVAPGSSKRVDFTLYELGWTIWCPT